MNDDVSGEGEAVEEMQEDGDPPAKLPSFDEAEATVQKLKRKGLAVAQQYRTIAGVNESFYAGDHWSVVVTDGKGAISVEKNAWFDSERVPKIAVNLYTGLLQTWCALLTSDRPTVSAVPASDEPQDTYRAAIAQKAIEFAQQEVDTAQCIDETVGHAARGGTAGIKIVYLADEDRITWKPLSLHDFLLDPSAEDGKDAGWVIFEDHIAEDEAQALFEQANIDHDPVEKTYRSAAGDELFGIERHELWHRPCRKWPQGFYACFVDGRCVEVTGYPYVFGDDSQKPRYLLPLVTMTVRKQRGSVYGRTNFTDAVPLQRAYNEAVARVQKMIRTTSMIAMKVPAEIAEDFKPGDDSIIKFPSNKPQAAREIGFTSPPEISQAIFSQRDFLAQSMEQVVGINSLTSGSQGRSLSGRAIEHIVELDQNRNADCTRSMQTMIREAFRLHLALMTRFYTTLRQMKITNGDAVEVLSFIGSDIDGVDVRLEPASELDNTASRKEAIAGERVNAGLAGPEAITQAQRQPSMQVARATVRQMFDGFVQGYPLNELPGDVNEAAVLDFVQRKKAEALATQDMGLWVVLERFLTAVRELLQRASEAQPVQPAEEQQPQPEPGGVVPPVGVM